jgi:D-amino peptidase
MEGCADITSAMQCNRASSEFNRSCELMTGEARAACDGAMAGGATEILVNDAHADMRNIDHDKLPTDVRLIRGSVKPLLMMEGLDANVAGVALIGYHAPAATVAGILDHAFFGSQVYEMLLNGETCGEARLNAAIAGDLNVPVIFISGDQTACADARRFMPWIGTAVVKEALGKTSAICMSPAAARKAIEAGVSAAVRDLAAGRGKPYRVEPPVTLEIGLTGSEKADVASMVPGVERTGATTVRFVGASATEVYRAGITIMRVASTIS